MLARLWSVRAFLVVVAIGSLVAIARPTFIPAAGAKPSEGWTLHLDALWHFPGKPGMVAHHYC